MTVEPLLTNLKSEGRLPMYFEVNHVELNKEQESFVKLNLRQQIKEKCITEYGKRGLIK